MVTVNKEINLPCSLYSSNTEGGPGTSMSYASSDLYIQNHKTIGISHLTKSNSKSEQ